MKHFFFRRIKVIVIYICHGYDRMIDGIVIKNTALLRLNILCMQETLPEKLF